MANTGIDFLFLINARHHRQSLNCFDTSFMLYTGDPSDVCAITFVPVGELERPVGFDSTHAFECTSIVEWLTRHKGTNPMTCQDYTGKPMADILHPLIVNGDAGHVATTSKLLSRHAVGKASWAISKFGSDAVLFLVETIWRIYGGDSMSIDIVTMGSLYVCLLWQYPICGKFAIFSHLAISVFYTLVMFTAGILSPNVTMSVILHVWCVHLFAVKVVIDMQSEVAGANIG